MDSEYVQKLSVILVLLNCMNEYCLKLAYQGTLCLKSGLLQPIISRVSNYYTFFTSLLSWSLQSLYLHLAIVDTFLAATVLICKAAVLLLHTYLACNRLLNWNIDSLVHFNCTNQIFLKIHSISLSNRLSYLQHENPTQKLQKKNLDRTTLNTTHWRTHKLRSVFVTFKQYS